jgi:hypothetical protein
MSTGTLTGKGAPRQNRSIKFTDSEGVTHQLFFTNKGVEPDINTMFERLPKEPEEVKSIKLNLWNEYVPIGFSVSQNLR